MLGRRLMILLFLVPFSLFVGTTALITIQGVYVYQNLVTEISQMFDIETPLSYISTKVKQLDQKDAIKLMSKENTQVLVFTQTLEGDIYETWIYKYKGYLYEAFMVKGMAFELSEGIPLLEIDDLKMTFITPNTLEVAMITPKGVKHMRIITIRNHQLSERGKV